MRVTNAPKANGVVLDVGPRAFGAMTESDISDDADRLRARLEQEGYLLFRSLLPTPPLDAAASVVLGRAVGVSDRGLARPGYKDVRNGGDLAEVRAVVADPELHAVCGSALGGVPMAFDYVWTRVLGRGESEPPHCDTVYMNRGTRHRLTAWIPLVDVPLERGPLMVLEGSHRDERLHRYRDLDVDLGGHRRRRTVVMKHGRLFRGFHYSRNPAAVQRELGRRWVTTSFERGDAVIFSTSTLHATIDNATDRYRVSLDARFQLGGDAVDDRYVGDAPVGHRRSRVRWVRARLGRGRITD